MASRNNSNLPKVMHEMVLIPPNALPGTHKKVYLYCTHRSDGELVRLYRQRNPLDQSKFFYATELGPGELYSL